MGKIVYDNDLKFEFCTAGHKMGNEIIDIDSSFNIILKNLTSLPYDAVNQKNLFSKKELITNTKSILDNLFNLHDVNIVSEKVLYSLLYSEGKQESDNYDDYIKSVSKIVSPYNIPIQYSYESKLGKCLSKDSVYFFTVCLDRNRLKYSIPIYIHELIHTQLDSQKGVVINYHNNEVFSIFLEILSSMMLDGEGKLLRNVQLYKYKNLLECIEYLSKGNENTVDGVYASMYVVSILKAEYLFDKYLNSNNKKKTEILQGIQNVFDGKETVEDYLERYNISLENSKRMVLVRKKFNI